MLLRKLTETASGEFILRLPKLLNPVLEKIGKTVIIHKVRNFLVIESAGKRLKALSGRRLDKLRPRSNGKAK